MDYLDGALIIVSGILSTAMYRCMLKLSWIDRIRHSTMLRMEKSGSASYTDIRTLKKRKLEYYENVMRNTQRMSSFS